MQPHHEDFILLASPQALNKTRNIKNIRKSMIA